MKIGNVDYSRIETCPLSNDWIFGKIFSNERVLRTFLEELPGIAIGRLDIISTQETEDAGPYFRGIRADIYAKDTDTFLFNAEMQNKNEGNLEYRMRFQQAVMDSQSLTKGDSVEKLRESYIIFVCNFDYYKQGNALYERVSYIRNPPRIYNDGSHILVLNSNYTHANTSGSIQELLLNLNEPIGNIEGRTLLMQEIKDVFGDIKMNPALREDFLMYGSTFRAYQDKVVAKVAKYMTPEVLAECFDISLQEAKAYVATARNPTRKSNSSSISPMSFTK